ncbi:hypothetical protein GALMADRAFT_242589 [Galerina marginata CBS 339.88]|uniref:GDP/GTP exchange factor Sec2 N-terminal domain-containing protein n=1 Tax=Galerina marginata (strain CBS 339.88) TaxID=685588 RepID=A0A067TJZ8_GALM3|nr:hypothetical protein GALMADRAFT_242589 [Galerina marginata CBS 339.88]
MAEDLQEVSPPQQNGTQTLDNGHERVDSHSVTLSPKQRRGSVDKDAQEMVIESLRAQIQDLFSQVSQLNNKLVKSYDRVSDLEDDLHVASANIRTSSLKVSQLELERTQHLSALNTGLLVEKAHVTSELNRLMEKATEEAAQRGQAESARIAIEKDLDDLSASLFGQANTMVAEARFEKHLSERKVEDAERALKSAEEAVQVMQAQMQAMQAEQEEAEKKSREMEMVMGKGKWTKRRDSDVAVSLRLLSTHSPYQDYLAFLAHLRILHPTSPNTPAMSTLLQLPFLARLLTEDSEPTVRLDLAPSLNWLSRRSVLAAIHSGQLMIEPMSPASLFAESATYPTSTTIAGINSSNDNISCALCGVPIFPTSDSSHPSRPPVHPQSHLTHTHNSTASNSWSGAFFKKTGSIGGYSNGTQPSSPTRSARRLSIGSHLNTQIFIFRLASPPTSTIASLPLPSLTKSSSASQATPSSMPSSYASTSHSSNTNTSLTVTQSYSQNAAQNNQPTTIYPLCMSGWCLNRLRSTCTLWAFVRTGIVEKVWEEELPPPPPPPSTIPVGKGAAGEKPPIPPRKRGLWGIASAIGERAASWSEGDKEKGKKIAASASGETPHEQRRLPPPLPPVSAARSVSHPPPVPASTTAAAPPPPLPKRNEGRSRTSPHSTSPPPRSSTENITINDTPPPAPSAAPAQSSTARTSTDLPPIPLSPIRGAHLQQSTTHGGPPPIPPRAHTPSNVPLPESRPATPAGGPASGPAGPPRTASPAGGPGVVPPPIPRRAAARARGGPGGLGSRPVTPANADAPAAAGVEAETPATAVAEDKPPMKAEAAETTATANGNNDSEPAKDEVVTAAFDKADAAEPDTNKTETSESAPEKQQETVLPDRSLQPSPGSEVFVDAPTTAPQDSTGADETKAETEEKQENMEAKNAVVDTEVGLGLPGQAVAEDETAKPAVNGHVAEGGVHVNGVVEDVPSEALPDEEGKRMKEQEDREKEKEKDKAGFVSDATWEERTWKELVRLREDMFWARVGGFRV